MIREYRAEFSERRDRGSPFLAARENTWELVSERIVVPVGMPGESR